MYQDPAGKPIYFIVPSAIWDQYVDEIFASRGVSFGIVNVPMKVRFENSNSKNPDRFLELDANVNLGLSAAAYWTKGKEQSWFTPVGITITQIRADSTTSEGYLAKTENRSGFSIFGGVVYQKGDYQIGLLLGADWATGDISKHWVYQGKPWLGVGIGIGLFQANNKPIKKN